MDNFGDYIYIILVVVFSIVGAARKKRKKQPTTHETAPKRNVLEDLFGVGTEIEDPVPQPVYTEVEPVSGRMDFSFDNQKSEEETSLFEVENVPDSIENSVEREVYDIKKDAPVKKTKSSHLSKRNVILESFRNHDEVRKAVIYSEILKPKF